MPIPATPDPQRTPTSTETPSASLPIIFGTKTSRSRPVRVRRDPGTLTHVPFSTHRYQGTPLPSRKPSNTNQHLTSSSDLQCKTAHHQQSKIDRRCHTSHQNKIEGQHQSPHVHRTKPANQPAPRSNINQELNDNSISNGNYFTSNQLQSVITIDIPDGFTPIVRNNRKTHSQPTATPRSYHRKIPTTTTTQRRISQEHNDHPNPNDTQGLTDCQSNAHVHHNGDMHNNSH